MQPGKYLDNGSNQGTAWRQNAFDDSGWKTGAGKFGYGIVDANTIIDYWSSSSNKYITTYFRKTISIANIDLYESYLFEVKRDDGIIIYVNGQEVVRNNITALGIK